MKKKIKKPKYTKKAADILFSQIIRKAAKCYRCSSIYNLQTAHIFSRWYLPVRYNTRNAVCLCAKCHMYFTYRPLEWEIYIKGQIGEEEYNELKKMALSYLKIDYQEVIERLQGQLKL